jgi:hypothetical protein
MKKPDYCLQLHMGTKIVIFGEMDWCGGGTGALHKIDIIMR